MDDIDRSLRRSARLRLAHVPRHDVLEAFRPDQDGLLEEVDRQDAIARGLPWYTSPRLSPLDKVFGSQSGRAVCIRYTNGLTAGEIALQKRLDEARSTPEARARIAAQFGEKK